MEGTSVWTGRKGTSLKAVRLPTSTRLGRPAGEAEFLVEPEHEEALRQFVGYSNRYGRLFLWLVLGLTGVCLAGAFLGPVWDQAIWITTAGTFLLGVTIWIFPFATPETTAAVGLRTSRLLARVGGGIVMALAVCMTSLQVFGN